MTIKDDGAAFADHFKIQGYECTICKAVFEMVVDDPIDTDYDKTPVAYCPFCGGK